MRLPSKGMGRLPGVDGSMRGSSIIFFMAASRVALSGHSIHEKATVSSAVAWTARRKSVTLPSGTSSPPPSITRMASSSMNIESNWRACSMNFCVCLAGGRAPCGCAGAVPLQNRMRPANPS
ncbi:hypothetical protein FQZ97_1149950 [compost metagenome]